MKQILRFKVLCLIVTIMIFMTLYIVSKCYFSELYLFEWTERHLYIGIWLVALILIVYDKMKISFAITFGNLIGIFIGQFGGDLIREKNMLKITSEMKPENIYHLQHHPGVEIWILIIIFEVVLAMISNYVKKNRNINIQS